MRIDGVWVDEDFDHQRHDEQSRRWALFSLHFLLKYCAAPSTVSSRVAAAARRRLISFDPSSGCPQPPFALCCGERRRASSSTCRRAEGRGADSPGEFRAEAGFRVRPSTGRNRKQPRLAAEAGLLPGSGEAPCAIAAARRTTFPLAWHNAIEAGAPKDYPCPRRLCRPNGREELFDLSLEVVALVRQ